MIHFLVAPLSFQSSFSKEGTFSDTFNTPKTKSLNRELKRNMDIEELAMMLETLEVSNVSEAEFEQAAKDSKALTKLEQDQQLILYSLYKQATIGDVNISKPWSIDVVGKAKWYGQVIEIRLNRCSIAN